MSKPDSKFLPSDTNDLVVQHHSDSEYHDMGAVFSADRNYRYYLWREWNPEKTTVAWIMANPSDGDGYANDHTLDVIRNYSKRWGYGSMVVANLFGYISTDPDELEKVDDPIGPKNDDFLHTIAEDTQLLMGAWGEPGNRLNRPEEVVEMFENEIHVLELTKQGMPGHPIGKSTDLRPTPYKSA